MGAAAGAGRLARLPVMLALAAFLLGAGSFWAGVIGAEDGACQEAHPGLFREGGSLSYRIALWPPGTKCVFGLPDGRNVERTVFPVDEVLTVSVVAWLYGLIGALGAARLRASRSGGLTAGLLLTALVPLCVLAGGVGYLFGAGVLTALLLALAVASIALARRR